jgi:flagellar basal-body rod modification protein FlgD
MSSYVSSILGTDTSTSTTSSSSSTSSLGMDAFLQLLVTQLEYQDPLDPMDDKEFVAELAQFSSLEQLTEINSGIDSLIEVGQEQEMIGAVNFMGKTVEATGTALSLDSGTATDVTFTLPDDAATCIVNVLDSSGDIVRTVDLGATAAGDVTFTWDGMDYDGNVCDDGLYQIAVTATDADGNTLTVTSTMTGTVSGIKQVDGTYYLDIGDDRYVQFTDIVNVVDDTSSSSSDSSSSDSSSSSSDSST